LGVLADVVYAEASQVQRERAIRKGVSTASVSVPWSSTDESGARGGRNFVPAPTRQLHHF